MKTRIFLLLAACLLLAGVALASEMPSLDWNVIGGGGGYLKAGTTVINATIGQPVVGEVSTSKLDLCSGFWCGSDDVYNPPKITIYLPVVMR
jgi:hypothetical protein